MRLLFIMDPLESLDLATDTSLLVLDELEGRRHESYAAEIGGLYLSERAPRVRAWRIASAGAVCPPRRVGPEVDLAFDHFDLVLMRKDPPVDAAYLAATCVLERAAGEVPVVNDPTSLRTLNEKLLPLAFPDFTPPTLVSSDVQRLREFAAAHGRIVLKPLGDCSGRGILIADGRDCSVIDSYVKAHNGQFVVAQKFLTGVAAGDKRIFLVAGDPVGAVNRVPQGPERLANIHQGASIEKTALTPREHAIVAAVKPLLIERGLWLAGLDVIDGHLTEVNFTSPSGARQINAVSNSRIEVPIVQLLECLAEGKPPKPPGLCTARCERWEGWLPADCLEQDAWCCGEGGR